MSKKGVNILKQNYKFNSLLLSFSIVKDKTRRENPTRHNTMHDENTKITQHAESLLTNSKNQEFFKNEETTGRN